MTANNELERTRVCGEARLAAARAFVARRSAGR
jgi:hypothetical protein